MPYRHYNGGQHAIVAAVRALFARTGAGEEKLECSTLFGTPALCGCEAIACRNIATTWRPGDRLLTNMNEPQMPAANIAHWLTPEAALIALGLLLILTLLLLC